ncbi:M20 family metallopeptidase [Microbacterium hominis]|uniref:M20 family metallopeptidase n=1 Tax=Microbacterium hominis TaxID=162426 RepID=A0A7D4TQ85_9MICO|nr:M20 family metallopeptidase [Microbacterium hominis]
MQLSPSSLRHRAGQLLPQYLRELAHLVSIDSGTHDAEGVDAVGRWCSARLAALGFAVEHIATAPVEGRRYGQVVVARRRGSGTRRVLLFAHLDTVYPAGTAAARPFRERDGRAYGPGVCDDKGGALAGIHAAQVLVESGFDSFGELVLVFTPDEEVGSPASAEILAGIAAGMDAALCLECARENGDLVVARKGVADIGVSVRGRAAHSGVEPERGRNAAVEAARILLDLDRLNGRRADLTVNVGVLTAGERPNIVPGSATLSGEVRAKTAADLAWALEAIEQRAAAGTVPGVTACAQRAAVCPPLERTATRLLFDRARDVGAELGIAVGGAATGGVSDANFVAARGVPVLDGMGPIGGDDHSEAEWLDVASVPDRVALLALLVARVGEA